MGSFHWEGKEEGAWEGQVEYIGGDGGIGCRLVLCLAEIFPGTGWLLIRKRWTSVNGTGFCVHLLCTRGGRGFRMLEGSRKFGG